MRLFRASTAAFVVLGIVLTGAVLDDPESAREIALDVAPPTTGATTTVVMSFSPRPRLDPTTTLVSPEGDDDPAAVDGRSWTWDQLADCESGAWGANKVPIPGTARWDAVRAIYQGGLQFAAGTWDGYKEPGYPEDAHLASREQQIVVAEKVIARQGPRAWPTCAPRLGMIGPDLPLDDPIAPSVPLAEARPG